MLFFCLTHDQPFFYGLSIFSIFQMPVNSTQRCLWHLHKRTFFSLNHTYWPWSHVSNRSLCTANRLEWMTRMKKRDAQVDGQHCRRVSTSLSHHIRHLLTNLGFQFKPLDVSREDPVGTCKIPAKITGSGTVFGIDKEKHSFVMFPTSFISASPNPETLPIWALLEKSPRWPDPTACLPSSQSLVAFTGKLAFFEDHASNLHSNVCSQAVVTLNTIIYLQMTPAPAAVSNMPSTLLQRDADTIALKSRVLKYAWNSSVKCEDDSVSSSSKTATSQEENRGEVKAWINPFFFFNSLNPCALLLFDNTLICNLPQASPLLSRFQSNIQMCMWLGQAK